MVRASYWELANSCMYMYFNPSYCRQNVECRTNNSSSVFVTSGKPVSECQNLLRNNLRGVQEIILL